MIGWLWRVLIGSFRGCKHEFTLIDTVEVKTRGIHTNNIYVSHCSNCGKFRKTKAQ